METSHKNQKAAQGQEFCVLLSPNLSCSLLKEKTDEQQHELVTAGPQQQSQLFTSKLCQYIFKVMLMNKDISSPTSK